MAEMPKMGFLRLPSIIGNPRATPPIPALLPIGKSTWWAGVKDERLKVLRASTVPASREQIDQEVIKLSFSYPSLRATSKTDAALMVKQYTNALSGVPLWALRSACEAIARGAVPDVNLDFFPASARLRKVVDSCLWPIHSEAQEITKILEATVAPPDSAKMAAKTGLLMKAFFKTLSQEVKVYHNAEDERPDVLSSNNFKAPSIAECSEIYRKRKLPLRDP